MTEPPLIEIEDVTKQFGGLRPLRIRRLALSPTDRVAISGLDAAAAETLVHLITGASVPDTGVVRVAGRDTRDIASDTEWLASLDRFGIVTRRAVLLESLPVAANLALPLTLAIDPMSDETRAAVEALADEVHLARARLGEAAATLTPDELVRVHLARSLATRPAMLLLEHPTAAVRDAQHREALARTLTEVAAGRGLGWLALTEDETFTRASGARVLRLAPATGDLSGGGWWTRLAKGVRS